MFNFFNKRLISIALVISLLTPLTTVFSENTDNMVVTSESNTELVTPTAEPTAAPLVENDDVEVNNEVKYYSPEPVSEKLLNDTVDVWYNEEDIISDNEQIQSVTKNEAVDIMSTSTTSSLIKKEIWKNAHLETTYYQNMGGNVSIDNKSGSLMYSRNDVSIPVGNGNVLDCPIEYNSAEAYALNFGTERAGLAGSLIGDISYEVANVSSPLGLGWSFGFTRMRNGVITLRDGRTLEVDEDTNELINPKYADITFVHNEVEDLYSIQYLDGHIETFDELSFEDNLIYIKESHDKYGNMFYYDSDAQDSSKITKIRYDQSNNGTNEYEISIVYGESDTIIFRPDGSSVSYIKGTIALEYGREYQLSAKTTNAKVLTRVETQGIPSLDSYEYDILCEFTYTGFDSIYLNEVSMGNNTHIYESRIYAAMSTINNKSANDIKKYTYINSPAYQNCYYPCVKTIIRTVGTTDEIIQTYNYTSEWVSNSSSKKTTTTVTTAEGTVTKTEYNISGTVDGEGVYTQKCTVTYKYNNNNLKILYTETITPREYPHLIKYVDTTKYGIGGQYISGRTAYTYNEKDKITSVTETVDGNKKSRTVNTYDNDRYCSLLSTVRYGVNDSYIENCNYTYNIFGDMITGSTTCNEGGTRTVTYTYDSRHNIIHEKREAADGEPIITQYEYSSQYNYAVPTRIYTTENGSVIAEQFIEYNPYTNLSRYVTDGVGNTEEYIRDDFGRIEEQIHHDDSKITIEYSDMNGVLSETNENGYKITYNYANGAVSTITESNANSTTAPVQLSSAETDRYGRTIKTTDAEGNVTEIKYDGMGRQTQVIYPDINGEDSITNIRYYDVFLEGSTKYSMVMVISPENKVSCEYYDIFGRHVKTVNIVNPAVLESRLNSMAQMPSDAQIVTVQTISYSEDGFLITTVKDGEDRTTDYIYDSSGNLLGVIQGDYSLLTAYYLNANGDVVELVQGVDNKRTTYYEYDSAGRLVKMTDPMNFTEEYEYDKAGNVTRSKDKNGVWTTNEYDTRNRLISTTKGGQTISYTYDSAGNQLTQTDSNGTITYAYNPDGTLYRKTMPDGKRITYNEYDGNKRLLSMSDYFGNGTTYTYDGTGNILTISETYSGRTDTKTTAYTYNQDSSLASVSIPNSMTTSYTYDYAGRVTYINNYSPYLTAKSTHTYAYDNAGNIIKATETMFGHDTAVTTYTYDSINRLSEENGVDWKMYRYDEYNNLTAAVGYGDIYYYYDANNRLIKLEDWWTGGETADGIKPDDWQTDYVYDNNGKLLSSSKNSAPGCYGYVSNQKSYTYDVWGRLTGYSDSLGESGTYTYYADGLRRSKTVGSDTYKYYYNGDYVVNETRNGSNFATNVYGVDGPISRQYSGMEHYYFKNAHGDVIYAFTSGKWRSSEYSYSAYGEEGVSYDYYSANPNPIRYSGEYFDTESGMTYLRARYYDPFQRRFISEDPIRDGANWYAYCGNNPVMFVDPSGLAPGDVFSSAEEAAKDFGEYINSTSINENAEYGTYIYSYVTYQSIDGKYGYFRYYSYVEPYTSGLTSNVSHKSFEDIEYESNYSISVEAYAHTHGGVKGGMSESYIQWAIKNDPDTLRNIAENTEAFSKDDKKNSTFVNMPSYLVTPTGKLKVYNPNSGTEKVISSALPYDPILNKIGYFK